VDLVDVAGAIEHRERMARALELDPLLAARIGLVAELAVVHPPASIDEVEVVLSVSHGCSLNAGYDNNDRMEWRLVPLTTDDVEWLVELKARAMRADLERLGRWDPERSRERLLDELVPEATRIIVMGGESVGTIALVSGDAEMWLKHFYVEPDLQGRGLGGAVLAHALQSVPTEVAVRLLMVRGSPALRLYERHGFRRERDHENGIDVVLVCEPG
jgi:GNAT superfamily N-acetyltransferase